MKRSSNPCESWREQICLLVGNALSNAEQGEAQTHLATCAECRKYHDEIRALAAPLADWEKHFSRLEPQPALKIRWAKAVLAAKNPEPVGIFSFRLALRTSWFELIRPCRHAWAALAALWLVMWGINTAMSDGREKQTSPRAAAMAATFPFFEEQKRVLAELMAPVDSPPAVGQPPEPPRRQEPRPRSERRVRNLMV